MYSIVVTNTDQMATGKRGKLFQMRIDQDLSDDANRLAAKKNISLASLVRILLSEAVEKDKRDFPA